MGTKIFQWKNAFRTPTILSLTLLALADKSTKRAIRVMDAHSLAVKKSMTKVPISIMNSYFYIFLMRFSATTYLV